jgi:hypothetical protein
MADEIPLETWGMSPSLVSRSSGTNYADHLRRRLQAGIAITARPEPKRSMVEGSGAAIEENWTSSRTR